jgi:futalosine hydrolase
MRAAVTLLPGGEKFAVPERARFPFAGLRDDGDTLPVLGLAGCDLYLLICGVGPVAAALSLGACLGGFRRIARREAPDGVLNLGLAGSYDLRKAPVGSLLSVGEEHFPEYGIRAGTDADCAGLSPLTLPQIFTDAGPVFTRIALDPDAALTRMGPALGKKFLVRYTGGALSCGRGAAVTMAGISGDPAFAACMAEHCGGLAENMEGFALALACASARIPFAEFRAFSNAAGYRPPHTWNMSEALAALSRLGAELFCPA